MFYSECFWSLKINLDNFNFKDNTDKIIKNDLFFFLFAVFFSSGIDKPDSLRFISFHVFSSYVC